MKLLLEKRSENREIQECVFQIRNGVNIEHNLAILKDIKFGTKQWANETANIIKMDTICPNLCFYCYAITTYVTKLKVPIDPTLNTLNARNINPFTNQRNPSITNENRLKISIDPDRINALGLTNVSNKVLMLFSAHDIFPEMMNDELITLLKRLINKNNELLITTKPTLKSIKYLCESLKGLEESILFRFTITSDDENILRRFEPFAPSFKERMDSLDHAKSNGFHVSASMEPFLSHPTNLIQKLTEKCEEVWVGIMNRIPSSKIFNKLEMPEKIREYFKQLRKLYEPNLINQIIELGLLKPTLFFKESIIKYYIRKIKGLEIKGKEKEPKTFGVK